MSSFTSSDALFLGTVLEALTFGVYSVVLFLFLRFEIQEENKSKVRSLLFYPITFLGVLCFLSFALDFYQQYEVVANKLSTRKNLVLFNINLTTSALYGFIDWLSQLILIYRCWTVWGRRHYLVIVPLVLSFSALALTLAVVHGLKMSLTTPPPDWVTPVGIAGFSLSLGVNAVVSALLVTRIWLAAKEFQQVLPDKDVDLKAIRPFRALIAALIETGMLTFIAQLVWVILFATQSPGFAVVAGSISAIYGITPTLLAIRVTLQKTYPLSSDQTHTHIAFVSQQGTATGVMSEKKDEVCTESV